MIGDQAYSKEMEMQVLKLFHSQVSSLFYRLNTFSLM